MDACAARTSPGRGGQRWPSRWRAGRGGTDARAPPRCPAALAGLRRHAAPARRKHLRRGGAGAGQRLEPARDAHAGTDAARAPARTGTTGQVASDGATRINVDADTAYSIPLAFLLARRGVYPGTATLEQKCIKKVSNEKC